MGAEELTFSNEGAQLRGTLWLPDGPRPCPVMVVAHGAQAGSRDYFLYRHLERLLDRCGIGTFRFDRRGEGASTGEPDAPYEQLGRDVAAALHAVSGHPDADTARLGLWGISQGGWISLLGTVDAPPVAGLVIVSGTPVTPAQQMTHAVTHILRGRGHDETTVRRALETRAVVERYSKGELALEDVAPLVDEARGEPWFADAWIPDLDEADWRDMDLDVTPLIRELRIPTLLFFGDLDPWMPVPESIAIWEASSPSSLDLTIEVVAGAGHEMLAGDPLEMPTSGEPVHAYEETLARWATRVLGAQAGS